MRRVRSFVSLTLVGGLAVILPLVLFLLLVRWLAGLLHELAQPVTAAMVARWGLVEPLASLMVLAVVLALCFFLGLVVRTRIGSVLYARFDEWLGKLAPGYRMVRDTVAQLFGAGERGMLRGEVALVRIHGPASGARQAGIVTARHGEDFTVYVPTAPLPTQGFVYHLSADCVELRPELSIEDVMRMVFACGAGASQLLGAQPIADRN